MLGRQYQIRLFFMKFLKHKLGKIDQMVLGGSIAEMAVVFPAVYIFVMKGKCQAVHTEDNIFHRVVGHCLLRMFYMGVDNHQVIRFYRH